MFLQSSAYSSDGRRLECSSPAISRKPSELSEVPLYVSVRPLTDINVEFADEILIFASFEAVYLTTKRTEDSFSFVVS